jgi:hypothetical protein
MDTDAMDGCHPFPSIARIITATINPVNGQKFSSAVEATVIQSRQTETRRSNKCIEPIFTNKSQRVSKLAH